jgi:hypothetical protein
MCCVVLHIMLYYITLHYITLCYTVLHADTKQLSFRPDQSSVSPCNVLCSSLWNYHGPEYREGQSRVTVPRDL